LGDFLFKGIRTRGRTIFLSRLCNACASEKSGQAEKLGGIK